MSIRDMWLSSEVASESTPASQLTITPNSYHRAQSMPEPIRLRIERWLPLAGVAVALVLWGVSLPRIDVGQMRDYGLIPVLPLTFWVALVVLLASFSVSVGRSAATTQHLAAHVVALIVILHATPTIAYPTLRYSWAWKHVGLTDFFQRNSGVDTSMHELVAYQYWPGFFNINAFLVKAAGFPSAFEYAAWAPPVFNVLLIGPLFLIFRTFTEDRRLVWTAITIYFLGAWVGQDYFAPQACAWFLYLTIIALVLRYLRPEVQARDRRIIAALAIIPMLSAIVPTHQLTPPMAICGLGALAIFRIRRVGLVTLVMIGLTLSWDLLFAWPFVNESTTGLLSSFGNLAGNATSGLISLGDVSHSQEVIAKVDRAASAAVWLLALVGFARRFRRRSELALPLLAVTPLLVLMSNDYDGEIIFRVYLFGLPFAAFYAAAAFYPRPQPDHVAKPRTGWWAGHATRLVLTATLLLLVTGFTFGYYGKEQTNYFTPQENEAGRFLYGIAPRGSLIVSATAAFPWAYMNLEFNDHMWFWGFEAKDRRALLADPVGMFSDMMTPQRHHHAYLILTRGQDFEMKMTGQMPGDALGRIDEVLSHSPRFRVIYRNHDAVVFTLNQPSPEAS
jgi:hypothetical protein